ncbi:hypothetical protein X975_09181, partial [Stegodyphus mimosarum]
MKQCCRFMALISSRADMNNARNLRIVTFCFSSEFSRLRRVALSKPSWHLNLKTINAQLIGMIVGNKTGTKSADNYIKKKKKTLLCNLKPAPFIRQPIYSTC